ncbi:unnamed protein product [Ceratitis capitata]|uniref:(Mediterranean fruit fly) hypothetical protein n=1 Tax=Ceratitis capitata TaxID=7213 RepID=A0A811V3F3_CERCA|nr:unnamed protein product [Ceratitis capitata]
MRKFIILASLVVCCVAAPTLPQSSNEGKDHDILLDRPSPINPDVPSDPKPEEKITKIIDPKEIVKYKREIENDPYEHISRFAPTAHPAKQIVENESQESSEHSAVGDSIHHRQKRERTQGKDTPKSVKAPVTSQKPAAKKDSRKQSRSRNTPSAAQAKKSSVPVPAPARDLPRSRQRRQVDPHLIGASTVAISPLIYHEEEEKPHDEEVQSEVHSQESASGTTNSAESAAHKSEEHTHVAPATTVKRDIPVPLVPKYHHPEESPKSDEKPAEQPQHVEEDYHNKNDKTKSSESDESDESSENSKEKTPVLAAQNHQLIHPTIPPQLPEQQQSQPHLQVPQVAIHADNAEVHLGAPTLAGEPGQVHNSALGSPLVSNTNPIDDLNDKPLVEELATIKPTQIIEYETPANEETVQIKHPIPVAELFSRHKP